MVRAQGDMVSREGNISRGASCLRLPLLKRMNATGRDFMNRLNEQHGSGKHLSKNPRASACSLALVTLCRCKRAQNLRMLGQWDGIVRDEMWQSAAV